MNTFSLIIAAGLALGTSTAHAATVTQSKSGQTGTSTSYELDTPIQFFKIVETRTVAINDKISGDVQTFDLFDAGLGTLNSVTVNLTGQKTSQWHHNSLACTTEFGIGSCNKSVVINMAYNTGINLSNWSPYIPVISPTTSPIELGHIRNVAGSIADPTTIRTNSVNTSLSLTSASDLAGFIGTGTFETTGWTHLLGAATIRCSGNPTAIPGTSASIAACRGDFATATSLNYNVSVTYDYTAAPSVPAVPLPATSLMLLGGLAGFAALRRRKMHKS